jgi:hypothetical protein
MATSLVRLGSDFLRTNPNEIRWNFKLKTNDAKTLGGKVIQITGLKISDITVKGQYAPDRREGDKEAWQQELRFRDWVDRMTEATKQGTQTMRFAYAPRGWDFNVFLMSFSPTRIAPENIAPSWEIKLFPVSDSAKAIVDGIKDLYIKRLMDGVGWKQTDYNGPTQSEVDATLAPYGGSAQDYLEQGYEDEAYGGAGPNSGRTYGGVQQ